MDNWIYCDVCSDPTSFQDAMTGLEKHNQATCYDCLKKLDREYEAKQLAIRSREQRRTRIQEAYKNIGGKQW